MAISTLLFWQYLWVLWVQCHCSMHLSVALRQHAQFPVQLGSQHVGISVARRQEDGMVSISQGSAPVLQVHMCHCPVEPVGDDKAVRVFEATTVRSGA